MAGNVTENGGNAIENKRKNQGGRPPFEPAEDQRYSVRLMASIGVPQDDIAGAIGITDDTLRKHFRAELDHGKTQVVTKIAESLYRQAMAGNVSAAIFWLKTQAGWKETDRLEHTGPNGGPVQTVTRVELVALAADDSGTD